MSVKVMSPERITGFRGVAVASSLGILFLSAATACSPSLYSQGMEARRGGREREAVRLLRLAVEVQPEHGECHRELGIACHREGDLDCALLHLRRADELGALNGEGLYSLGSLLEARGSMEDALSVYSRYWEVGRLSHHRRLMVRRVREFVQSQAQVWDITASEIPDNSLAILRMVTLSQSRELKPIGVGLTDWLMTDLQYVDALRVLERLRVDAILEEHGIAAMSGIDPRSAPELGRLLGAQRIVTGTVLDQGEERIRVDLFVYDIKEDMPDITVSVEGRLLDFFSLQKRLVFELLDRMGMPLTAWERTQIERIPTRSLAAFLTYSQAVQAEWAGRDEEAETLFRQTAEFDPTFDEIARDEGDKERRVEETVDNVTDDLVPDDPEDEPFNPPESRPGIPGPPNPPGGSEGIPPPPPPGLALPGGVQ